MTSRPDTEVDRHANANADAARGVEASSIPVSSRGSAASPSPGSDRGARFASRRRLWRRAADALLVIVGVSTMVWMDRHRPNLTANQAPFPTRGTIGAAVRGRDFAVTVERVALTRALDVPGSAFSAPGGASTMRRETSGVWLLVDARLEALREPTALPGGFGAPSLRTRDGFVYASAGDRMPGSVPLLTAATASPGIPARGLLVFELPPERLPGAVLVASRRILSELDSIVEIDLRLTDADVRRLIETMPSSIKVDRGGASW